MKRFTFTLMALLALSFSLKAQQYVSTEPANRNVIIEEYTGRNCGYCTDGHARANQIMQAHPGRVWAINIHYGSLSPTSAPNLNLPSINPTLSNAFPHDGIPTGVVNRSTTQAVDRGQWASLANTQLNQAAECNVDGRVMVNPDTRVATITVEVYYTGNNSQSTNYLTIAMLQDSIIGSQADYGNYNPSGWVSSGQYSHMHVLRDIITDNIWGDAISPTTQGTLITRTYEYAIPEIIGNPNGVVVDLNNIHFLAFVTQQFQGTPTRPILNACQLEMTQVTNVPIYPIVNSIRQEEDAQCTTVKSFDLELTNIGANEINSMRFNVQVGDVTNEFEWEGEFPSGDKMQYAFEMDIPFGTYDGIFQIVEVNGESYDYSTEFTAKSVEWHVVSVEEETTTLKVYIIQDQFGEQITWDIVNSGGEVIAAGGPYQHLIGSGATQANMATIPDVPANDCYLFRIYDTNSNGICCNYGNGYYYVKDGKGNVIFGGEGNGDYGAKDAVLFSIVNTTGVESEQTNALRVYPNPADQTLHVDGDMTSIEVFNAMGQCLLSRQVNGNTQIDLSAFTNGIYFLRVYNDGEMTVHKFSVNK